VTEFRDTATDWEVRFDEIEATVCLWHGEDDTNVPVGDARRLARRIPTADLRLLDGTDHLHTLLEAVPRALEEH
jgi:pimeloyl-ACP methyl ester carboxylesterase